MESKKPWQRRWQDGTTGWDLGSAHPEVDGLINVARELSGLNCAGLAYVPGCGRGHEAAHLARLGFQVTAADFVEEAVFEAQSLYQASAKIAFKVEDALKPQDQERFDVVVDRAMLCALQIENRKEYIQSMHYRLKPGGLFIGVLFASIDDRVPGGPPFSLSRDELWNLFSPSFSLVYLQEKKACTLPMIKSEWLGIWKKFDSQF